MREITDGLSNTILAGDKHVPLDRLGQGGWDSSLYNGSYISALRSAGPAYPLAQSPQEYGFKFGSYHPGLCQFVFADGSVRAIPNAIDPAIFGLLADRGDGQVVPEF